MRRQERIHLRNGLLFAAPWLVGLVGFLLYPVLASLFASFCDYSTLQPPIWIGAENYADLAGDAVFYRALGNSFYYAAFALPLGIVMSFALALLLNTGLRRMALFRTIFYLPALVPIVASALLWLWILNGRYGVLNYALSLVGIQGPTWLADPIWAKPALILMSLWGVGGAMVIYLAALQDVPQELYESAEIDGAGYWSRLVHITIPTVSPVIYFNLIMGIIGVFQIFSIVYIMTGSASGSPARSTLFYALYLWQQAFDYLKMGYASAMAWILFVIILCLTMLAHRAMGRRVFYSGEGGAS